MIYDKNENYKIVIIGESTVGKSSIFVRYTQNDYYEQKNRTINATSTTKLLKENGDTAGEEKYHALAPIFYRDADGAILVFDLTKKSSFELIDKWFQEITTFSGNICTILCGNKCDLKESIISYDEGVNLAEKYNSHYISTSAKLNINIDDVFSDLVKEIYNKRLKENIIAPKVSRKSVRISTKKMNEIKESNELKKKTSTCC